MPASPAPSWESYLRRIPLSPMRVKQIRDLWAVLERMGMQLPFATVTPSGEFSMAWDKGRHHFEVDLSDNGTYDWFYMDRESEDRAGEEGIPVGVHAPEMFSYLHRTMP